MAAISQSERIRRKMHKDLTKARDTGMLDYYDPKISGKVEPTMFTIANLQKTY